MSTFHTTHSVLWANERVVDGRQGATAAAAAQGRACLPWHPHHTTPCFSRAHIHTTLTLAGLRAVSLQTTRTTPPKKKPTRFGKALPATPAQAGQAGLGAFFTQAAAPPAQAHAAAPPPHLSGDAAPEQAAAPPQEGAYVDAPPMAAAAAPPLVAEPMEVEEAAAAAAVAVAPPPRRQAHGGGRGGGGSPRRPPQAGP